MYNEFAIHVDLESASNKSMRKGKADLSAPSPPLDSAQNLLKVEKEET